MTEIKKPIHLLYVPTLYCNMSCSYCYLGLETDVGSGRREAVDTLKYAIESFTKNGYIPYNLSFHGGEVTTLPAKVLEELFELSQQYYRDHVEQIRSLGFTIPPLHIKTNLYNFHKHYELLEKYEVSISGSVDLPLRLHEKYRRNKHGVSTLPRIVDNLKLLASYPHRKKISCVVTKEHLDSIDEFIADIHHIHYDIGLDMERFNIMFSFDSSKNREKFEIPVEGTQMLRPEEQVAFYRRIKEAFAGTELEGAMRTEWFKEFTPEYCCSASNCGSKFFLLQGDGEVFSCPRGQASTEYRYGNIFRDTIENIIANGTKQIELNENRMGISDECLECEYFSSCNLGCPFVRSETGVSKSYTCLLQKELYRDDPLRYPPLSEDERKRAVREYLLRNKHAALDTLETHRYKKFNLTHELYQDRNSLMHIIEGDTVLRDIYLKENFRLEVDGRVYALESQILKNRSQTIFLGEDSSISLHVAEDIFSIDTHPEDEPNNTLHIMLLRDTPVVYGDEARTKQEHLWDYSIYRNAFVSASEKVGSYYRYDIAPLLIRDSYLFLDSIKNNIFFTTKAMREYHYKKQQKNAFYHIAAINLPFSNIEFYWIKE